MAPEGSLKLEAGEYKIYAKVWLDQGVIANKIYVVLQDPEIEVAFTDLKKLPRREWITVETTISKATASGAKDAISIEISKMDLPKTRAAKLYIDDIVIKKN